MHTLCHQPDSLAQVTSGRRWFVFMVGMLESMVWSGTVFGWASLVHVMKLQGVYGNLCSHGDDDDGEDGQVANVTTSYTVEDAQDFFHAPEVNFGKTLQGGCDEQDARFALIYVVANVVYATPGILVGYALHHLGLAFTRISGGVMVTLGFVMLSLITAEEPDYLWAGVLLLSVGGNMIRMAGLQLADLFPSSNSTAMAFISGIYTPSAAVMMLLQVTYEAGMTWHHCCWMLAGASSLVVVLTPLFPRHQVPYARLYDERSSSEENSEEEEDEQQSIKESLLSFSSLFYLYWAACNLFSATLFSTHFNAWINKFAKSQEETSAYSIWFGLANILCVLVLPVPGVSLKLLDRFFTKGKSGVVARVATVQSMVIPLTVVSLSVTTQISMLLLYYPWAVYVGLVALMLNRPSILAIGNPFVRVRYPVEHFNRLQGFQSTTVALITLLQYPHFVWAQHRYLLAMGVMIGAMLLTLVQPLHLLSRQYLTRVLTPPGAFRSTQPNHSNC